MNTYFDQLQSIATSLSRNYSSAEVVESDAASFVFASKNNKAIELYKSENDWHVEYWIDDEIKHEKTYTSAEEATLAALEWA